MLLGKGMAVIHILGATLLSCHRPKKVAGSVRKGRSISLIGVLFSWIMVAKIIIHIQQRSIKDVEVDHKV